MNGRDCDRDSRILGDEKKKIVRKTRPSEIAKAICDHVNYNAASKNHLSYSISNG